MNRSFLRVTHRRSGNGAVLEILPPPGDAKTQLAFASLSHYNK